MTDSVTVSQPSLFNTLQHSLMALRTTARIFTMALAAAPEPAHHPPCPSSPVTCSPQEGGSDRLPPTSAARSRQKPNLCQEDTTIPPTEGPALCQHPGTATCPAPQSARMCSRGRRPAAKGHVDGSALTTAAGTGEEQVNVFRMNSLSPTMPLLRRGRMVACSAVSFAHRRLVALAV